MKNILQINSSEKTKKKIQTIAKNNQLDFDFVNAVFSFKWDFDGFEPTWVKNTELEKDENYYQQMAFVLEKLGNPKINLSKTEIVNSIFEQLKSIDKVTLDNEFIFGAFTKNYALVSQYASFHYLKNATLEKLETLDWDKENLTENEIIDNVFYKIFRGGSIERYKLKYLYADLSVKLPYQDFKAKSANWVSDFIENIEKKKDQLSLKDLQNELKTYCKGDKFFLQTVLEALSYSGILKVENLPTEDIFIPDNRNELSNHHYSNEWTYPLRFWSKQ